MIRFLKRRHYNIAATGVVFLIRSKKQTYPDIRNLCYQFMDQTGVSYTVEDIDNIERYVHERLANQPD